jgi:3-hydroxyacyl-[acyl-carrier-protein] dehydratase
MRLEYFRMVDRIARIDPEARRVWADCAIPEASPIFEGHFPGYPLLPGVLIIETIAQTGGWLVMGLQRFAGMPFLAQVREAKMRAPLKPGDRMLAEASLLHDGSGYAVASGQIRCGEKLAAEAEIRYRVAPFPNDVLRRQMLQVAREIGMPESYFP